MPCLCRLETLFSAVFVLFLPVYHFLLDAQFSLFIFRMYCSHDLFFSFTTMSQTESITVVPLWLHSASRRALARLFFPIFSRLHLSLPSGRVFFFFRQSS